MLEDANDASTYPSLLLQDPSSATQSQMELMTAISEADRRGSRQEKEALIWLLRASLWGPAQASGFRANRKETRRI